MREASAVKPVWAVANDSAFSAAYAIGAAANRLIVSETGGVGSIGVIALHIDQSVKDANEGYRTRPLSGCPAPRTADRPWRSSAASPSLGTRATLITSQLPVEHWHAYLNDPTLADAILDRVLHAAHKLTLSGESQRKRPKAGT